MSLVGISIALLGMITTVIAATKQYSNPIVYFITRSLYLITRAIPELIWAMLLVFIFKPGLWAGALALGLHNLGILSKLCAEVIESMEQKPLQLLKQSGANKNQLLIYGVIPSVYKRFISYIIYRWEIILRTTIVVGIVGAGGLGYYFKLHFSFFHYTHITLVIIIYLILVRFADYLSHQLNKLYS
jgi:phosphonate transport system permease protein